MFCRNCGAKNDDTSVFCVNCGKRLSVTVEARNIKAPAPSQQKLPAAALNSTHSYHNLGGWLAFMTYGMLIIKMLQTIAVAIADFALLKAVGYLGVGTLLFAVVLTIAQLIDFNWFGNFSDWSKRKTPVSSVIMRLFLFCQYS